MLQQFPLTEFIFGSRQRRPLENGARNLLKAEIIKIGGDHK